SPAINVVEVPIRRKDMENSGRHYFVNISIGSPQAQPFELLVDTGSSDMWVYGMNYYNPRNSSTGKILPLPHFEANYSAGTFKGHYVTDYLNIGSRTVRHAEFAMIDKGEGPTGVGGLLALGFDTSQFAPQPSSTSRYFHPTILDQMYNESIIDSRTFGIYLGKADEGKLASSDDGHTENNTYNISDQGSLILGGYDKSKFLDPLLRFTITSPSTMKRLGVPLTTITATISGVVIPIWTASTDREAPNNDRFIPAIFDSGDEMANIPPHAYIELLKHLQLYIVDGLIDCRYKTANISVNFTFMSQTVPFIVQVPFSELVLPILSCNDTQCLFALQSGFRERRSSPWLNMGSSVLSSLYMLVDYDLDAIYLAKSRRGAEAKIVAINH
ncbi:aspartic peptidase domain-containing protein, partial [Podospora fimiseda]